MAMCMLCRKCFHRWVAVASVPSEAPAECPHCGEIEGIQQPEFTELTEKAIGLMKGNTILLESLMGMVNQHFLRDGDMLMDSSLSSDDDAIATLIEAGMAEVISCKPLRYRLLWNKLAERTNRLKNGEV